MMKKLIAALTAAAMCLACAAMAETIAPMEQQVDLNEGTYPVSFDRDNLSDGQITEVLIFTEDCYDPVDVSKMAVGDSLLIDGETVEITSLGEDDYGDKLINGGMDEGGYELRQYEGDNCWKAALWDDMVTYTDHGEVTLTLADDVTFTDSSDIDQPDPVTATGIEAVSSAIADSANDDFCAENTTVRIEGGKVVEITRTYTP